MLTRDFDMIAREINKTLQDYGEEFKQEEK